MNTLNLFDQKSGVRLCTTRSAVLPTHGSLVRVTGSAYKVGYISFIVEIVDNESVLEVTILLEQV